MGDGRGRDTPAWCRSLWLTPDGSGRVASVVWTGFEVYTDAAVGDLLRQVVLCDVELKESEQIVLEAARRLESRETE